MQDNLAIPTELPENFTPTAPEGLTEGEAAERVKAGLDNRAKNDPGKSVWQILGENFFSLFNLLNFALAAVLILVGSYRNMLFLGVVVSNTVIGTFQELRARHTIRRLTLLNAPTAHVLRDGKEKNCKAEELVLGDLVVLRSGDQVLADAVVMSGSGAANESLLTGESDAVSKREGAWLLSGSYITEGKFIAQLVHVGEDSYASRLTRSAKAIKRPKSALMTDLNKLLRVVSIVLVPLGVLLFCKQYFLNDMEIEKAVPECVAAMVGMIPEGLILLTSVAMAVGVVRLGRRKTLVQELYGIETLARADVLCLDKTGTITTGDMRVDSVMPLDADEAELKHELSRFLGAFDLTSGTLDALRAFTPPSSDTPTAVLPFSSQRKKSAASFADGTTLVLGAPNFVLEGAQLAAVKAKADETAAQGIRVVVLAACKGMVSETDTPPVDRILGLIFLSDTLREHAAETLQYFKEQGVTVKVISGDDPRTVSAIAKRVCLDGWDAWVDASTLTEEQLPEAVQRYTVFGRVTPPQKKLLVEALKAAGHSVAMTGDGVNDIPALKAADCSIAMAGGSDAAKHAAQLTLLDADFASMPLVVAEGRRVVNNITRAASLFLVKTLYSFGLSVLTLFMLYASYPFQPIQLTLISTLTIGTPSFFLALQPNSERISGSFMQNVLLRAIPGAAAVTACAAGAMALEFFGFSNEVCSTLATLSAGAAGIMVLFSVCRPLNLMRGVLLLAMAGALTTAVLLAGHLFFLVPLAGKDFIALGALFAMEMLIMAVLTYVLKRHIRKSNSASAKA